MCRWLRRFTYRQATVHWNPTKSKHKESQNTEPPKARICSERAHILNKAKYDFALCNDSFCEAATNLKKPDLLPKAKYDPNLGICGLLWQLLTAASILQKPNIVPKVKICSKDKKLSFAMITFGRLLPTSKRHVSCQIKYAPNMRNALCCDHFWKEASNFQQPDILRYPAEGQNMSKHKNCLL